MSASLYVVATPIGNLDDITLRALSILKKVALIAAEDTRRTGTLLRHFGITTPTTSFHAHNERQKLPFLLRKLADGQELALVSDAGTPVVADPGQRLIAAAITEGVPIVPVPGASAVMAALVVSGVPADSFMFLGFAPARSNDRLLWLQAIENEQKVTVFFEAPHRIKKTLTMMGDIFGKRPIIVCRELTKLHEQVIRLPASDAAQLHVAEKGEFTIVVGPRGLRDEDRPSITNEEVYKFFCQLTETSGISRRPAMRLTADKFGLSTKRAYALVEHAKNSGAS